MKYIKSILYICICTILLAACTNSASNNELFLNGIDNTAEVIPTATPEPIVNLSVCLASIPDTIEGALNHQILNTALYGFSPHQFSSSNGLVLSEIPSTKNNTLYQKLVKVEVGDKVIDNAGQLVTLEKGTLIKPAGCTADDCAIQYDGEPIEMAQIVAVFSLNDDLTWDDGTKVTVEDAVFAYKWKKETLSDYTSEETQSFSAIEGNQIEWVGIPGLFTHSVLDYFNHPLPKHLWESENPIGLSPKDFMGYSSYFITDMDQEQIVLRNKSSIKTANEINQITLKNFPLEYSEVGKAITSGECDIVEPEIFINNSNDIIFSGTKPDNYRVISGNGNTWVNLYMGIVPNSYDDIYSMWGGDRANYFGEIEMRQYISQCIPSSFGSLIYGEHAIETNGYFSDNHPNQLQADNRINAEMISENSSFLASWPINSDGIRYSIGNNDIFDGTLFEVNLFFPDFEYMHQTAQIIADNLLDCGIKVNLSSGPTEELYKTGEEGLIFGRNFDLALIPWQTNIYSVCELLSANAIPGKDLDPFPYGWGGWNATGWKSENYDSACNLGNNSLIDSDNYINANQLSQAIMEDESPIVPLFVEPTYWAINLKLCGIQIDELTARIINFDNIFFLNDNETECP